MKSWVEFEKRFRDLAANLRDARINHQWGAGGESWLIGSQETPATQEFELLCSIAGEALLKALKKPTSDIEHLLFKERNAKERWYRALKAWSGGFKNGLGYLRVYNEKREFVGNIFSGSIENPALYSANLCLRLQAEHPIRDKSLWRKTWDDYGKQIVIGIAIAAVTGLGALVLKLVIGL